MFTIFGFKIPFSHSFKFLLNYQHESNSFYFQCLDRALSEVTLKKRILISVNALASQLFNLHPVEINGEHSIEGKQSIYNQFSHIVVSICHSSQCQTQRGHKPAKSSQVLLSYISGSGQYEGQRTEHVPGVVFSSVYQR